MENSSFFNAIIKDGIPDRVYKAESFAKYFSSFIGNGVYPNPATNLQVLATDNNMSIRIKPGMAYINGYIYINDSDLVLNIPNADGVLNRIDSVVIRLDLEKREIKAHLKKGNFSTAPTPQEISRSEYDYELVVAHVRVNAGTIKVTQSMITDTRLDSNLCGIVTGVIDQVDTSEIYRQLQADIEEKGLDMHEWLTEAKNYFENDFNTWFETIKDVLDGDVAGNLLNEINKLKDIINKMELTSTKVTRPNGKTVETSLSEHDREIENLKLSVSDGKKQVASAITDKGVPTLATDTFKTMSDNIRDIVSYSDLSIKISAQVDEPLEPKDGDLWLVTDVEPSKIVLSHDETKIKREENAIFVKLKFLDMICNFNDTMSSLLEIPNQTIIDYKKGEKRSEIRGVGIAKGGVIDLYADFSFAKMYSNSEFKLLPVKYFYNGEWITVDNGFDYIYIVRDGNIALFNPNSNSVVWQISRTMNKNPAFCINSERELLVQGMPSIKINKVTKGGEVVELPFYDSDYIADYDCLGVMEDKDKNILLAYPLYSNNYTRFVKLNKDGQKIFQVDEQDRVLSSYRYGANRYYISAGTIINENSEFAIVYYYWENGQKSTHAKFFDSSGKRVKYNSNFFTLTSDHYIRKIKISKTGEVFALAYLKGDRDHITTKCMILKYDSYDTFKAGKISKRIGLPNFLLADDFHITDDKKLVLIQYTINSSKKIITIDTKTMQIISEVISNIPEKTYAYTVTRDGRCITNSHIISPNGSIAPINGLSNISNGSTNIDDYRCLNSVTESNFE